MRFFIPLFFLLVSCVSQNKETWSSKMQDLAATMSEVTNFAYSKKAPVNKEEQRESLESFYKSSKKIDHTKAKKIMGDDPLVHYSIEGVRSSLDSALRLYDRGRYDLSKRMIKRSVSYCYYCHTRSNFGPKFNQDLFNIKVSGDDVFETNQILIATRQYDKAIQNIKDMVPKDNPAYYDMRLYKSYLQVAIKSGEPEPLILKQIEDFKKGHKGQKRDEKIFKIWTQSIKDWQVIDKGENSPEQKRKILDKNLLAENTDKYFVDALYLSNYLHNQLAEKTQSRSAIYYDLGRLYYAFPELQLWDLSDLYFASCILNKPGSSIAKKCYKSLEEAIYFGYTGSAGTNVPASQKLRLKLLKEKAQN